MLKNVFDNIWQGLVPPRVEMLVWFVLMETLCTKELLRSRNTIPNGEVNCVLCGKEEENARMIAKCGLRDGYSKKFKGRREGNG
ncbi:hypothetical protein PIB30_013199 [Stylosanthes scabra]|uniref:Reverse transcriptase zinc-binding domain-containing protein n=1 Tax=Stylosanthes scabra TaxID=79078 RepID=A0ABU6Z2Z9_9FABA|nr:hypothetical protein [Stylosanthes scabra]